MRTTAGGDTVGAGLGARLRQERERRGMSLRQLARMTGLSHMTLGRLEQGKREASWRIVCVLADALHVPLEYFRT